MRLQKYLAAAGIASRRKCEELILAGEVKVNGTTATLGMSVEPGVDTVEYDGRVIKPQDEKTTYIFYKPAGVICSSFDPQGRKTVQDFFNDMPERLYNVGRLDYDSEGLLVMTNDGELANALTHPSREINKKYYVICDGKLTPEQKTALENCVELEDGLTAPALVEDVFRAGNGNTSFYITIHEGRNRQIRRMLKTVGHETLLLRRVGEGTLKLGDMKPGERRKLSDAEIDAIKINCAKI